jgi:TM2 domain-containing membrane protein YozV
MLIEQRVTNEAKSTRAAYLLWLFLGTLGAHRFYLGSIGSAVLQLLMFIIGWATLAIGVSAFILIALGVWVLIDGFLVSGMTESHKEKVRRNLTANAMLAVGSAIRPAFCKIAV